jgi:hypothetical protein
VEDDGEEKREETGEESEAGLRDCADEEADGDEDLDCEDDVAALPESHPAKDASLVCGKVGREDRVTRVANGTPAAKRPGEIATAVAAECFRAPSKRKTLSKLPAAAVAGIEDNSHRGEDEDGNDRECQGVHGVRFPSLRLR